MKKVGIITLTEGCNYGNRLQNYAVQTILTQMGFSVDTIKVKSSKNRIRDRFKLNLKMILNCNCSGYEERVYKFNIFNKKYISFSRYICEKSVDKINDVYDYFVCGSDQIWNPLFQDNTEEYYLSFVANKPKIALAASFGVSSIPEEKKDKITGFINRLDNVSVREESGKEIINELCCKNVEVLFDPTIILDKKEWVKIEKKPRGVDGDFIFCYLLGEYSCEQWNNIEECGNKNNAEIVYLRNEFKMDEKDKGFGPDEFLWLIHHCKKVITDSYHAIIFSLIFEKQFTLLKRPFQEGLGDMSTRLICLGNKFGFGNALGENNCDLVVDVDYKYVEKTILEEKERYREYLQKAFGKNGFK